MDTTEVTNAQYAEFLITKGSDTSGQPPECSWNTDYTPGGWPATERDDYPVVHVDWCDAYAFCAWAGKRLCGRIEGGANDVDAFADAAQSQWYNACSAGGTRNFPYGVVYEGSACNGGHIYYGEGMVLPVGSHPSCEGGYPGLFDLSGNVYEWEDSCDAATGTEDRCLMRGGTYSSSSSYLRCDSASPVWRSSTASATLGFRCCAEGTW